MQTTNENDLILDPFAGTGTRLVVAYKKKNAIGIEQKKEYVDIINKRLNKEFHSGK